jgi:hypothetical protein
MPWQSLYAFELDGKVFEGSDDVDGAGDDWYAGSRICAKNSARRACEMFECGQRECMFARDDREMWGSSRIVRLSVRFYIERGTRIDGSRKILSPSGTGVCVRGETHVKGSCDTSDAAVCATAFSAG